MFFTFIWTPFSYTVVQILHDCQHTQGDTVISTNSRSSVVPVLISFDLRN